MLLVSEGGVDYYLDAPPLCPLPFDLVEEILCRSPVKLLLQLQCVCKSWNSLISDPRFAKKHLSMSRHLRLHYLNYSHPLGMYTITSCPLQYVSTAMSTNFTHLNYPSDDIDVDYRSFYAHHEIVGSCNGIIFLTQQTMLILWNPSIRKAKKLPSFEEPYYGVPYGSYGFGYDLVTGNYKVVALLRPSSSSSHDLVRKAQVKIHTLGTNFWKKIGDFPFDSIPDIVAARFLSGAINWLASKRWGVSPCFIVSLDLGTESYQKVSLPPHFEEVDVCSLSLNVLMDCLCIISGHDVWIMKEYGNKESWTKLYTVPYLRDPGKSHYLTKALYIFEDDRLLLECMADWGFKLIVYDPKISTSKFVEFENNESVYDSTYGGQPEPEICVESLISPVVLTDRV
ncbi:hypothetical protein TSUD_127040 [Trifolium subterraneum]|nr:hypothetical protein TSUD_127040 [Trifolium subterraneum]